MSEPLRYHLWVNASLKRRRGIGVSQVVEADHGHARRLGESFEGLAKLIRVFVAAIRRCREEVVILVDLSEDQSLLGLPCSVRTQGTNSCGIQPNGASSPLGLWGEDSHLVCDRHQRLFDGQPGVVKLPAPAQPSGLPAVVATPRNRNPSGVPLAVVETLTRGSIHSTERPWMRNPSGVPLAVVCTRTRTLPV